AFSTSPRLLIVSPSPMRLAGGGISWGGGRENFALFRAPPGLPERTGHFRALSAPAGSRGLSGVDFSGACFGIFYGVAGWRGRESAAKISKHLFSDRLAEDETIAAWVPD